MSPELDKKLCEKYPELFRDRHGDPTQTLMCWGFNCGDGWYSLIDSICEYLMADVNRLEDRIHSEFYKSEDKTKFREELIEARKNIPVVVQVKEKFGGLRFYVDGATKEQYDYIRFAEKFSYRICEECGTTNEVKTYTWAWHKTLCSNDAAKLCEMFRDDPNVFWKSE